MKKGKAINKFFGYTCVYEVHESSNTVRFWLYGKEQIWLGVDDFFNHFEKLNRSKEHKN